MQQTNTYSLTQTKLGLHMHNTENPDIQLNCNDSMNKAKFLLEKKLELGKLFLGFLETKLCKNYKVYKEIERVNSNLLQNAFNFHLYEKQLLAVGLMMVLK